MPAVGRAGWLHALFALSLATACTCAEDAGSTARRDRAPAPAASDGFVPEAGGVAWTAEPPLIMRAPQHEMRVAEYVVRGHPAAILAVSHFGPDEGGGGDVQANVDRWLAQLRAEAGGPTPAVEVRVVNDLTVTTVDARGTFVGRRGEARSAPQPGWRLLGAIVEGPRGLIFFKFTGPEEAIALAEEAFGRLVRSLHPA